MDNNARMIPAMFLSAALALPVASMPDTTLHAKINVYHALLAIWQPPTERRRRTLRVLFPSAMFEDAYHMDNFHLNTYILGPEKIGWRGTVQGTYDRMPFRDEVFHLVVMDVPRTTVSAILEAHRVLKAKAILMLTENGSPHMKSLIERIGFHQLPFQAWEPHTIYQKLPGPEKRRRKRMKESALALPVAMTRPILGVYDEPDAYRRWQVGVFARLFHDYPLPWRVQSLLPKPRIYLIGGADEFLEELIKHKFQAYRHVQDIYIATHRNHDIVAKSPDFAFKARSARAVVYMLQPPHLWVLEPGGRLPRYRTDRIEETLDHTLDLIMPGGFFFFYGDVTRNWPKMLWIRNWYKLPYDWNYMQIWRKPLKEAS